MIQKTSFIWLTTLLVPFFLYSVPVITVDKNILSKAPLLAALNLSLEALAEVDTDAMVETVRTSLFELMASHPGRFKNEFIASIWQAMGQYQHDVHFVLNQLLRQKEVLEKNTFDDLRQEIAHYNNLVERYIKPIQNSKKKIFAQIFENNYAASKTNGHLYAKDTGEQISRQTTDTATAEYAELRTKVTTAVITTCATLLTFATALECNLTDLPQLFGISALGGLLGFIGSDLVSRALNSKDAYHRRQYEQYSQHIKKQLSSPVQAPRK